MKDNEREALKAFLLDADCLKQLDRWKDKYNLFDVLRITNMEIRHSNILAWLLDPNENHGLGDSFIRELVTRIQYVNETKVDTIKLLLQDFYTYQILREANHMDIVLLSQAEKTVFIIENKIWSGESKHQLKDYLEKSKEEYQDCDNRIYVFLTPDGHEASDPDNWISISYSDVIQALENALQGKQLSEVTQVIIENYIEAVRRNIMKERDPELLRVCNEIYNQHRTALKLIFENVQIDNSLESDLVYEVLRDYDRKGKIVFPDDNRWQFFTPKMNTFLPMLNTPNSSWRTQWVYYYWFNTDGSKISIHLEFGLWNLTDDLKRKIDALIQVSPKKPRGSQFARAFLKSEKISQDNYEESLKKAVEKLVEAAFVNEETILTAAKAIIKE